MFNINGCIYSILKRLEWRGHSGNLKRDVKHSRDLESSKNVVQENYRIRRIFVWSSEVVVNDIFDTPILESRSILHPDNFLNVY